ncbi:ribonuclease Z [Limibacter armeniacum]|uniref:ribonuclease Z n=1 Tax=Limibacter armeniacum TaxID=466084 RepID=UPI002FE53A28
MAFEVTILGSSAATPVRDRYMTSQYVEVENNHFLIDCGEATQFQLIRHNISLHKISRIFISHLHGDHFFGLPGLLSTMHLNKRTADLHIHGPRGLDEVLLANFKHSRTVLNFRVFIYENTNEFPEVIFENDALTVETIPLSHRVPCTGFLIKEKPKQRRIIPEKLPSGISFDMFKKLKAGENVNFEGQLLVSENVTLPPKKSRSYAFCSDTRFLESIIPQVTNADLLYHEATFAEKHKERAAITFHSTAREAGIIAANANVGKLLIGHFSARYKDLDPLLEEAREVFEDTDLAIEGSSFEIVC